MQVIEKQLMQVVKDRAARASQAKAAEEDNLAKVANKINTYNVSLNSKHIRLCDWILLIVVNVECEFFGNFSGASTKFLQI